jgi:hypothetical protein
MFCSCIQYSDNKINVKDSFAFIFGFFVAAFVSLLVAKTEENANVKTLTECGFLLFVGHIVIIFIFS